MYFMIVEAMAREVGVPMPVDPALLLAVSQPSVAWQPENQWNQLLNRPLLGRPLTGRPLTGRPLLGRPLLGRPLLGRPLTGRPLTGRPLLGNPLLAKTASGVSVTRCPSR